MKRIILLTTALAGLFLCIVSCAPRYVGSDHYEYSDSVFIHLDETVGLSIPDGYSYFQVSLDIPVTNNDTTLPKLNDTLRRNILHWMLGSEREDYVAVVKEKRDEFFSTDGDGWVPDAKFMCSIDMVDQETNYVTYVNTGELCSAVSHSNPWCVGATFMIGGENERVGYDLFVHRDSIAPIVERALLAVEEEITDFRMPEAEPWIEKDFAAFTWGSYEIGSFALGNLQCKVPLKDVQPYLSEKGKQMLASKFVDKRDAETGNAVKGNVGNGESK